MPTLFIDPSTDPSPIDRRIIGKTPAVALPIFSSVDRDAQAYTRNVDCWARGLDLTGIVAWTSAGGNLYGGMLITPRHILLARHVYGPVAPATSAETTYQFRFVTANNDVVFTQLDSIAATAVDDLSVGHFDADVPDTITPTPILFPDHSHVLPAVCPVLSVSQGPTTGSSDVALVQDAYGSTASGTLGVVFTRLPTQTDRAAFYQDIRTGDSSKGCYAIVDGRLIGLAVWGSVNSGASISFYRGLINQTIAGMGGVGSDYTITEAGLVTTGGAVRYTEAGQSRESSGGILGAA